MSEVRKKSADGVAEREGAGRGVPTRVLVVRLVPALTLTSLLRPLRRLWPSARFCTVTATREGEDLIAADSDEVMLTEGIGAREALRRVRAFAPEVTIVAGGADYGLGSTYLKAALLARLSGARQRWQWNPGERPDLPLGGPLTRALARATPRVRRDARDARRYYRQPPRYGPREVQIAITAACNYHCVMCAFHNPAVESRHREAERARMSYEMFAQLIADLKRNRVEDVGLTGYGEPFMHPQAMEMLALALELKLNVIPTTNGSMLTDECVRRLVDMGLRRLHVSLNAATDETYQKMHPGTPPGRLAQVVARLRTMAEYAEETGRWKVHVRVSAVVTRLNLHEIPGMVQVAHEAQAGELALLPMAWVEGQPDLLPRPEDLPAIQRAIAEAKALGYRLGVSVVAEGLESTGAAVPTRSIYERLPCYMGYELCHIMADGAVHFCAECYFSLGNLHEHDFDTIWKSEAYEQARRAALELPHTRKPPGECNCFRSCCHLGFNLEVHRRLYGDDAVREIG